MAPPSRSQLLSCFIGSNIVALGAGTPYLYSFYAPQLLERCHIPVSQSSTLSFALTIGSAALGFIAGLVIDKHSPQLSCGIGAVCTFLAYWILRFCYVHEIASIMLVSLALALVGFGSVSGFYASVKCCTTNFPRHRGTAGAFPVSLYALAGLVYSSLCAWLFGDRMDAVFTVLMYMCSAMILTGCFTLRIMVGHTRPKKRRQSSVIDTSSSSNVRVNQESSSEQLAQPIFIQNKPAKSASRGSFGNYQAMSSRSSSQVSGSVESFDSQNSTFKRTSSFAWARDLPGSLSFWGFGRVRPSDTDLSRAPRASSGSLSQLNAERSGQIPANFLEPSQAPRSPVTASRRDSLLKNSPPPTPSAPAEPDVLVFEPNNVEKSTYKDSHLYQTITKPKYVAYYLILATLQGIGQTYIYSVGFVIEALVHANPDEKVNAKAIQSLQVSIISVMSFAGRLSAGPVSDLLVKRLKAQREWCVLLACVLMYYGSNKLLSDTVTIKGMLGPQSISFIRNVSLTSLIIGYAFGVTFGTFPAIIADQFGTEGFSTIWGLTTTGGIISVKLFSGIFARDFSNNTEPNEAFCEKGTLCYTHTFHVLAHLATAVGVVSIALIFVRYMKKRFKGERMHHAAEFIIDEDAEAGSK
ncbi:Nodulin-like domain-containing protein [Lachancea thermotolerans]